MYVLVFAWTRKTQILGRCNQRLSGKLSNPQLSLIVYQFHLTGLCLLPQFYSIPRPLLKLNGGHFLFQVAGIVRFICAIVRKPDGIIFAFIVIPFAGTNIAAGFSGADNSDSSHERNPHREMHRDCQRKLFHRAAQRRLSTGRSRNAFALHQGPANAHCDCRCCADTVSGRL